jgi:hypothetical protein
LVELKIKALLATFAAAKLKAEAWASKAAELREVLSQAARGSEAAQELLEAVDKPSPCKSSPRSRSTSRGGVVVGVQSHTANVLCSQIHSSPSRLLW